LDKILIDRWALGRIGRQKDKVALEGVLTKSAGLIRDEVADALEQCIVKK